VRDAHDDSRRAAVRGGEPGADVERDALSPAGEARGREERVEGRGEVASLVLLQEGVHRERADLGDGRLENVVHERGEVGVLAAEESPLGEHGEEDVLAAARGVGVTAEEAQH